MKNNHAIVISVLISTAMTSVAHEHWIDAGTFYPKTGETKEVYLCSGHEFPASKLAIKDRVLHEVVVVKPDRTEIKIKTSVDTARRSTRFAFDEAGVYLVRFSLKPPQMTTPLFMGKAIIVVGDNHDDAKPYRLNKGLEIVPESPLSELEPGKDVSLVVLLDGKRINARITIQPEGGKAQILSTMKTRAAQFKVASTGRHLLSTSFKGQTCSLTFSIVRQKASP